MDKQTLLTLAANSKLFRNLCNKLCNYRYISDDLFQEFLLYIAEKPEEFLVRKYNEIQFISYCSNVIKGLNSHRLDANKLVNTKNRLVEKHDYDIIGEVDLIDDNDYNVDVDINFIRVKCVLNKDEADYIITDKTHKEIAELKGLTVRQVRYKRELLKEKIKNEFNRTNTNKA